MCEPKERGAPLQCQEGPDGHEVVIGADVLHGREFCKIHEGNIKLSSKGKNGKHKNETIKAFSIK